MSDEIEEDNYQMEVPKSHPIRLFFENILHPTRALPPTQKTVTTHASISTLALLSSARAAITTLGDRVVKKVRSIFNPSPENNGNFLPPTSVGDPTTQLATKEVPPPLQTLTQEPPKPLIFPGKISPAQKTSALQVVDLHIAGPTHEQPKTESEHKQQDER